MAEQTPPVPTIAPDKLSGLTGFSLPELKKLAGQGYFPRAEKDGYDASKALVGCLRARKEQAEAAGKLPIFTGMGQCSGATGIPVSVLKQAKKAGCPAFEYSRVALGPFLSWFFSNQSDSTDWGDRLKRAQALREEVRLAKDNDEALDKNEIGFAINKGMSLVFSLLDRRSNIELPPTLKGLNEAQIQKKLLASDEGLKAALRTELTKYVNSDTKTKSKRL